MIMTKKITSNTPKTSNRIVGGLLIANVVAFIITAFFFSFQKSDSLAETNTTKKANTIEYVKQGWQVMHWAYSMTELFSDND